MERLRLNIVNRIPRDALVKPDINSAKSPIKPTFVVSYHDGVHYYHVLSQRETEIIDLIAENPVIKNGEIAKRTRLSPQTVRGHLNDLYQKFGIEEGSYYKKRKLYYSLIELQTLISGQITPTERLIREGTRITYEGPRYPYPEKPNPKLVGDHWVFEYIHPDEMDKNIKTIADEINLGDYRAILVNLKGGEYLFKKIAQIKNYNKRPPVYYIEYRQPEGGFGSGTVRPIPEQLIGKRCLFVDDLYFTGGVAEEAMDTLSFDSVGVFIAKKDGLDGQLKVRGNFMFAVRVDPDAWMGGLGGCGMDLERGTPDEDIIRNYGGIVTKCPPLPR